MLLSQYKKLPLVLSTLVALALSGCNNGTGIKAEEIAYIFDARYRASNAIQDQGKHTGLGLAITKRLLALLHSEIRVNSQLGQGTTFEFNVRKVSLV